MPLWTNTPLSTMTTTWLPTTTIVPPTFPTTYTSAMPPPILQPTTPPQPPRELKEPVKLRKDFPDIWIWSDHMTAKRGKLNVEVTAPDTITSWVLTAISMDTDKGLGVAPEPAILEVFRPFFARLDLPYSAIRGELLELKVLVFNYLQTEQRVTVTVVKPPNDEFYVRGPEDEAATEAKELTQTLDLSANDGIELSFWIKPVILGTIPIEVKAQSTEDADALRRDLIIRPEGEPQDYTVSYLFILKDETVEQTVNITFPPDTVDGSERVLFTLVGDILASTLQNLENLLHKPYGCGEQTISSTAPNVYVIRYLEATNQLTPELKALITSHIGYGYQRMLQFLGTRGDGSFSVWADNSVGALWLTTMVVRVFEQAKPYAYISQKVLNEAMSWIIGRQSDKGTFIETQGTYSYRQLSTEDAMTAYVLVALLKARDSIDNDYTKVRVERAITSAMDYIVGQLDNLKEEGYVMALVTYAMYMADHPKKDDAFRILSDLATSDYGLRHWEKTGIDSYYYYWSPPYNRPPAYSVETTAYGLMATLEKGDLTGSIVIVKWLVQQRNPWGGFGSTQDTNVGIESLTMFAELVEISNQESESISVSLTDANNVYDFDPVTSDNVDVIQQIEVDDVQDTMTIKATGTGSAIVQMSVFYNRATGEQPSAFALTVSSEYKSSSKLKTTICYSYTSDELSGMVVIESDQLTGHVPVTDNLVSDYHSISLSSVEFLQGKTLVLYLDEAVSEERCIDVISLRTQNVENLQPVLTKIYAYYQTGVEASVLSGPTNTPEEAVTEAPVDILG